ncbi:hypothetical protein POM88_045375 [Heracleum sosnowskyi]|uniref:Pyruvate kinase n=1 Tax=Heracleum sosnowskyi TaxID=360622 RepID=A0AAD8M4W2_9APIA|nr:hypothetical protein POM88_045375 [Heracleum sosnowskyi]
MYSQRSEAIEVSINLHPASVKNITIQNSHPRLYSNRANRIALQRLCNSVASSCLEVPLSNSVSIAVLQAREYLSKLGDLSQTQIFANIENVEGLYHFDEILQEADGIILSRGNLGIDLPLEKVFLFQKAVVYKCNMAGKPAVVTRVVDSMTDNLRPTRAEATDVANAILDGSDAILLGAETLWGLYPVETISIVGKLCAEVESHKDLNRDSSLFNAPKSLLNKSSRFFPASFFSFAGDGTEFTPDSFFYGLVKSGRKQLPKLVVGLLLAGSSEAFYTTRNERVNQILQQTEITSTSIDEVSSNTKPLFRQLRKLPKKIKKLMDKLPHQKINEEEASIFDVLWLLLVSVIFALCSRKSQEICNSFGASRTNINFKVFAVTMTENEAASNFVPPAPILLPQGPWKQVLLNYFQTL